MDDQTLISLLGKSEENIEKVLRQSIKGVRQYVDAGSEVMNNQLEMTNVMLSSIVDSNKERNGKIETLGKETSFFRLVQRNPWKSIVITFVLLAFMTAASSRIDLHRTIERQTGIEITDE